MRNCPSIKNQLGLLKIYGILIIIKRNKFLDRNSHNFSNLTFLNQTWYEKYFLLINIYFWLRFGLANTNNYLRLKIRIVCVGNF